MSLETMAKSRTYYPAASKPTSQPVIRVSSPDSKREMDSMDQKSVAEIATHSKESLVQSSTSSSNCQYETSSEGASQRIVNFDPAPINVSHTEVLHHPHGSLRETFRFDPKNVKTPDRFRRHEDESVLNLRDRSQNLERSESLPIMKNNRMLNSVDRISRADDFLVSESSHARLKKLKKIVAYVESTGWSGSNETLLSENTSNGCATLRAVNEKTRVKASFPDVREAFRLFNKSKGVTFLALNAHDIDAHTGNWENKGFRQYYNDNTRSTFIPTRREACDDLIDIAKNPNPSIKSIYFPPSPEDSQLTSNLGSVAVESRTNRQLPQKSSYLDALSRIDNELGPLQTKYSELAGKFRALNPYGMYNYRMDSSIQSPRMSTISQNISGYLLHRAETFCHHNSSKDFPTSIERQLSLLPTMNNFGVCESPYAKESCTWNENIVTKNEDSSYVVNKSPQASYANSAKMQNNQIRFIHEKPLAYGIRSDQTVQSEKITEKPECFNNFLHNHEHSSNKRWLPSGNLYTYHSNFFENLQNFTQPRITSTVSHKIDTTDVNRNKNIHLIDGQIPIAVSQDHKLHKPSDRRSYCVSRKQSISHRISDDTIAVHRVFSRTSRDVKNCHFSKEKIGSGHPTSQEHSKHGNRCRRIKTSKAQHRYEIEQIHRNDKTEPSQQSFISVEQVLSENLKVSQTRDVLLSEPTIELVDSAEDSESVGVETKTSFISYSQVLNENHMKSETSAAQQQQINFLGTYTERTVVMVDAVPDDSNIAESKGLEELHPSVKLSSNSIEQKSLRNHSEFDQMSRSSDHAIAEKLLSFPDSREKITIVPVMYTSGIPEVVKVPELYFGNPHRRKNERKTHEERQVVLEKMEKKNPDGGWSRRQNAVFPAGGEVDITGSLSTHRTHLGQECSFVEHEQSWRGQWTSGSRLSITYSRSNTSLCPGSIASTISTERTLKTDTAASGITISNTPRLRETRNRSPTTSRIIKSNRSRFRGSRNHSPKISTQETQNDSIIGITTSPEEFLDE